MRFAQPQRKVDVVRVPCSLLLVNAATDHPPLLPRDGFPVTYLIRPQRGSLSSLHSVVESRLGKAQYLIQAGAAFVVEGVYIQQGRKRTSDHLRLEAKVGGELKQQV
jgi:hypothetical protein